VKSRLYIGAVRHRRFHPVPHAFRYPLFMLYLDLAELPVVFDGRWLWSARRPAPAWFRRADYLGDAAVPLADAVRNTVSAHGGKPPTGPIRMLTHLRYFGYVQNPVTLYYCFDTDDRSVDTIVAEITNTPWGERHAYVLTREDNLGKNGVQRFRFEKAFHVSPFMAMDHQYDWRFNEPGRRLVVHMENRQAGSKIFDATLALRREAMTGRALASALARYPWITARVALGIYWQALRLGIKRVPFHTHPRKQVT